jgi:hypothetical protein
MENQLINPDLESETWSETPVKLTLQELITSIAHLYDAMPSTLEGKFERLQSINHTLETCQQHVISEMHQVRAELLDEVKF